MGLVTAFFPAFSSLSKGLVSVQPEAANAPRPASTARAADTAFAHALVALAAKLAAVDGAVNQAELSAFTRLFAGEHVEDSGRLQSLFVKRIADDSSALQYARQVLNASYGQAGLHLELVQRLITLATADAKLNAAECELLRAIAAIFQIEGEQFRSLLARHVLPEGSPYEVLGIRSNATDDELRAHYKVQVQKLHPDRYQAAGATPATIAMLSDQLASINAAYDVVTRQRAKKKTVRAFSSAGTRRNNKGVKASAA